MAVVIITEAKEEVRALTLTRRRLYSVRNKESVVSYFNLLTQSHASGHLSYTQDVCNVYVNYVRAILETCMTTVFGVETQPSKCLNSTKLQLSKARQ